MDFYSKKYRALRSDLRAKAVSQVVELTHGLHSKAISDSIWDVNPVIWYSLEGIVIRFDAKGLSQVCDLAIEYNKGFNPNPINK